MNNALLVDLGGVLFAFDHPHRLRVLGQCLTLAPDQVDTLLWKSGFSADCDAGRYPDAAAVRAEIRKITGYTGIDADLDAAWCSAFRPDQQVLGLLTERHGNLRYGVFTNNGPLEEEVLTRLYPDAFEIFADRFFGHRLVANKPDPAVYQQVTELLRARPGDIAFVDDSADNVDAANRCGWTAVQYHQLFNLADLLG
jgi:FMN phosphatase YigB (HAD superfamily)